MPNRFLTIFITFISIAAKLSRNIVKVKKSHLLYLDPKNNKKHFLSPTVPEDLENVISPIKTNAASDPNSIPNNFFQLLKEKFSQTLSDLIDMPFNQGVFFEYAKNRKCYPCPQK